MKKSNFTMPAPSLIKIKETILALHRAKLPILADRLAAENIDTLEEGAIKGALPRLLEFKIARSDPEGRYKKYSFTTLGTKLAKAMDNRLNSQADYWQEAVSHVPIYDAIIAYITNRRSVPRWELKEEIIRRAGKEVKKNTNERADTMINILNEAEIIEIHSRNNKLYDLISIREKKLNQLTVDDFLHRKFGKIAFEKIGFDEKYTEILKMRVGEIKKCLDADAPLSVIFLAGSILEGVLLGLALKYPKEFNQSNSSPKDKTGKVKDFEDWTLNNFIDVACDIHLFDENVKKYSHSLREFRNYIHPNEQIRSKFNPTIPTAHMSLQALKLALSELSENISKIGI